MLGGPYYGGEGCFTNDTFRPISSTIETWRKIDKCSPRSEVSYQRGDVTCTTNRCVDNTDVTLCEVEDGGHAWPGGYAFPTEQLIKWDDDCALGKGRGMGKITQDISAKDAMWEFFKQHPKK